MYYASIPQRMGNFKIMWNPQHAPEVVIDEWLKRFCNNWLKQEFVMQRGADYYERTEDDTDYSLGYYKRRIITTRGAIEVDVPRGEEGSYEYTLFDKYKRYSKGFKEAVIESLLLGHSTRKARRFFKKIYGEDCISQTFASNLLKRYDRELEKWKKRKIEKEVKILVLDAVHLKGAIKGLKRAKPVLFAYCIYEDGKEEILDFEPTTSESKNNWLKFCGRLYDRGLESPSLVVRDDKESIKGTIAMLWPSSKEQYCIYHLMQNFTKKLGNFKNERIKERIKESVEDMYESEDKGEFRKRLNKFISRFKKYKQHKAFRYLFSHLQETIEFYALDKRYHAAAKTTNRLERTFEEIRRRIKTFGRFPNRLSCKRWIYALITEELVPKYRGVISRSKDCR